MQIHKNWQEIDRLRKQDLEIEEKTKNKFYNECEEWRRRYQAISVKTGQTA